MMKQVIIFILFVTGLCCYSPSTGQQTVTAISKPDDHMLFDTTYRTVHVMVALCDNKYQGIVPVPAAIGNGQDPDNNLYWGCGYGIRTWFCKSKEWKEIKRYNLQGVILQRIIFKHRTAEYYLVADAYNGKEIKQCTLDFLASCSGQLTDTLRVNERIIGISGNARLLAYIGHNGLMDFQLSNNYHPADHLHRDAIIMACKSKQFFTPYVQKSGARPLVWTTGLMCPEAYTLHDALTIYVGGGNAESIRTAAAKAYAQYQKCSEKAARNLFVAGF